MMLIEKIIVHLYRETHKMKYSLILFCIICFLLMLSCSHRTEPDDQNHDDPIYLDPAYSIEERVDDLLSRMTLDEKIGQMTQAERGALQSESDIKTYFLGSLLSGGGSAPTPNFSVAWADMYDTYQSQAMQTRLKIPLIYGIDAVHGHNNVYGATIFPHNIGLGCTNNPALVEQAMEIVAEEVAATGIDWTFSPCIAVARDERWGRTYESFGETPELQEIMSRAAVRGLQGMDLSAPETILACAKHFVGDGGTTGGHDQGNTEVDWQTLLAIHMPGYIAAVEENVGSIMVSFSSWNGQKMHGNHALLTDYLKETLGFDGFLISDWGGIDQLPGDYSSDIEISVNAGLDMIMVPNQYVEFVTTLKNLVGQEKVPITRINDAVRRILRAKFRFGLFEAPYTDRSHIGAVGSAEHRQVARACVRESLVLLKNENNILPLPKNIGHIHVAGKNANDLGNQCGGWTISWQGSSGDITFGTTILEAIQQSVSPQTTVTYSRDASGSGTADAIIVVVGETPYAEGTGDRSDLGLDVEDRATIQRAHASGKPVIVILVSGRPMIIENVMPHCDGFIAAWLPGTEGLGVTDVVFGDFNPAGRLSHSWPRSMSQVPVNVGDADYQPLFPYGYGLSY